jgi:hypothetical protein
MVYSSSSTKYGKYINLIIGVVKDIYVLEGICFKGKRATIKTSKLLKCRKITIPQWLTSNTTIRIQP